MLALKSLSECEIASTVTQEENEEEWRKCRTHGIGGSDIGPICGVSPFSSARQIYLSKTGQYKEIIEVKEGSAAAERMHFGHVLEPVVADEYARRKGAKIRHFNVSLRRKDEPWALANVDRFIVDDDENIIGILECKTSGEHCNDEWESGDLLMTYIYQINWYLYVTGLKQGAVAAIVGGNKFYEYTIFRDDELINNVLVPAAKKFWFENVLKLVEPEMQAGDVELCKALYELVQVGSEMTFEEDTADDLLATIVECKAKIKELTWTMEEAQNRIKDKLRDKEIGYSKNHVVKWSPRSKRIVDGDRLKAVYPAVYEDCIKISSYREMRVKEL